jgi:DHA2 family multidrug resistance protein
MKDNMAFTSPLVQEQLGFFTEMLYGKVDNPKLAAYALLDNTINQQAFIIAINNIFIIIALMFCLSTLLLPFTSTVNNEGSDLGGH